MGAPADLGAAGGGEKTTFRIAAQGRQPRQGCPAVPARVWPRRPCRRGAGTGAAAGSARNAAGDAARLRLQVAGDSYELPRIGSLPATGVRATPDRAVRVRTDE